MMKQQYKYDIEQLLKDGSVIQIQPQGTSMTPIIRPERDMVLIEAVDPEKLHRGDVVLYRRDRSILVLHRLHHRKGDGFYMVGDAQTVIEGPLRADQIRGRMTAIVRKEKTISVHNPWYVLVSRIWLMIRPVRPQVRMVCRFLFKRK